NLAYGFLVERWTPDPTANASWLQQLMLTLSFHSLPPPEQRLVGVLLLLPVAALIVCLFLNLLCFGRFCTFAPALLGLAFRELASLPGILVFPSIFLIGWLMRRVLDRYHLLQVPRVALLLSLVAVVLIVAVVAANSFGLPTTKYVALFPMVI